jgi:hypothetical protein
MAHPTDPLALFCALVSAICALGYLFGALSHRVATRQGNVLIDTAGDPLGFRSVMAFQAIGAILFAAAALLWPLWSGELRNLAF